MHATTDAMHLHPLLLLLLLLPSAVAGAAIESDASSVRQVEFMTHTERVFLSRERRKEREGERDREGKKHRETNYIISLSLSLCDN